MKQVYAVGQPSAGPSVRAASPGVGSGEVQAALGAVAYAPPPGRPADADAPLPVRLALLDGGPAGRVLTHVAPAARGYFAHSLLNVPAAADAHLVIQTWGSPGWQTADPDTAGDLPELPYLPVADVLDDAAARKWLDSPARRELLEFVLAALLGTPPDTRVFVAASADDLAAVVYAVTRALPPGMLDDFTFSTYEPDPLACRARLIGHDTGSADWDLPAECYTDAGVAFNPATGRRSLLPADVPFAGFAVNALATSEFGPLDEFKATWQRVGLTGTRQFDLVFRLARGTGVLAKEEAAEALQHPPLAAWVSARTDALNQFLEWALDDREFAKSSFSRVAQALRQKPELLAKLGQQVREAGLKAVKDGDRDRTANALEVVLPTVAPAKANAVWGELLAQVTDPDALAWDMRWYLLPRFVRFKQQAAKGGPEPAPDAALVRWLDVPADRLGEALALDLPRAYHVAAGRACLGRDGEPSETLVTTLAGHPGLTLTLLQPSPPAVDADRAVKLFEALLAHAPGRRWLEDLLPRAADYSPDLLNRFFESALAGGSLDAEHLVRSHGPRLLELFAGQTGLDKIGRQFLAAPPADLLHNPGLLAFLAKLDDEPKVSDEVKARAAAVRATRTYLDAPTFTPEAMAPAAAALALSPPVLPASAKGELFTAVGDELLKRKESAELQADLEAALVHFGPVLANDPTDLYENLLRDLRGRTDFARHPNLVGTFLAVALGATKSDALAGKLDGLDVHALAVAQDAARRCGGRLLADIDRRAADWPKAAKTQWGFLSAAVRPRGFRGVLRDAALVLAGAAAASAAWWVAGLVR